MNFLPALCPVPFALGANWAVWIFGEMCPQVMLIELPLNMLVDFLHVGGARDATEPSAHPHHQHQHRHSPILPQLMEEVLQIHRH